MIRIAPAWAALLRYLLAGVLNALISYLAFLLLLQYIEAWLAYIFSYVAGMVSNYLLHLHFVFKSRPRIDHAIKYPLMHAGLIACGVLSMRASQIAGLNASIAWFISLLITTALGFLISRKIMRSPV